MFNALSPSKPIFFMFLYWNSWMTHAHLSVKQNLNYLWGNDYKVVPAF